MVRVILLLTVFALTPVTGASVGSAKASLVGRVSSFCMSCSPFGSDPGNARADDMQQGELVVPLTLPGQSVKIKRVVEQDKAFYHHLRGHLAPSALFTGLALLLVAFKTGVLERLCSPLLDTVRETREQSRTLREMLQLLKDMDLPPDSPEFRKALADAREKARSQRPPPAA